MHLKREDFIYDITWDEEIDTLFVDVLFDQAQLGMFQPHGDNYDAIGTAQYVVNKFFGISFDHNYCARQVRKLRKQHHIFFHG